MQVTSANSIIRKGPAIQPNCAMLHARDKTPAPITAVIIWAVHVHAVPNRRKVLSRNRTGKENKHSLDMESSYQSSSRSHHLPGCKWVIHQNWKHSCWFPFLDSSGLFHTGKLGLYRMEYFDRLGSRLAWISKSYRSFCSFKVHNLPSLKWLMNMNKPFLLPPPWRLFAQSW